MVAKFPLEIICKCLEHLPDVESLKHAILANQPFYNAFTANRKLITTAVLKNEIPPENYLHAVVHHATGAALEVPCADKISCYVRRICDIRKDADVITFSPKEAIIISRNEKNVAELCNLIAGDVSPISSQILFPISQSIQSSRPSKAERTRVSQAIYMYFILSSLFIDLMKDNARCEKHHLNTLRCQLQQHITELVAPWEFYHVLGVKSCFKRILSAMDQGSFSEREMLPGLLVSGLEFTHSIICKTRHSNSGEVTIRRNQQISHERGYAFDFVLSQALSNNWYVKWKKLPKRQAFCWNDTDFNLWKDFEKSKLHLLNDNNEGSNIAGNGSTLLESPFGLWSAALWDATRWEEIIYSLTQPESIHQHEDWDPLAIGVLLFEEFRLSLQE